MQYKKRPLRSRFETKFVHAENGCWNWTAQKCAHGYGRIKVDGKTRKASRVAYELYIGPIDDGAFVLHRCDNPSCVNPAHLFLGDHASNMRDMSQKHRSFFDSEAFQKLEHSTSGTENGNAILVDSQVLAIRNDSRPAKIVAVEYRVSAAAIYDIRQRRRWRHLKS